MLISPPLLCFTLFPYTTLFRSYAPLLLIKDDLMKKAIFLDRDGVINEVLSHRVKFVHKPKDFYLLDGVGEDRKSTRLNSSHVAISYAVFCLKKQKNKTHYK